MTWATTSARLDEYRWWFVALFATGYVAVLFGEYVLMHSGFGERQSPADCWYGDWVVTTDNALTKAGHVTAFLTAIAVSRIWKRQGIVWRIILAAGLLAAGVILWWMLWFDWSFDPACGCC